jgi:beta-amylase
MQHVPIYVMLPTDTVTTVNTVRRVKALQAGLRALKLIGVEGVMMHIWWGVVEGEGPMMYNWSAYVDLLELITSAGLKVQASMCFHGCSKLIDNCDISLPPWILSIGEKNPDIFFADRAGNRYRQCLSLAVDSLPLLGDRSPLQMYTDFLHSFRETFSQHIGNTIVASCCLLEFLSPLL